MAVNCNGSIKEYKKQVYVFDRNNNKVKTEITAFRVRYRYEKDGVIHQAAKGGFTSSPEAKKFLTSVSYDIMNNSYVPKRNITVNDIIEEWMDSYRNSGVRDNTILWHKYNLLHIKPSLGNCEIQSITYKDVQRFITKLSNNTSLNGTTISNIYRTLSQAFAFAMNEEHRYISKNPCKHPDVKRQINKIKTEDEFEAIAIPQTEILQLIEACKNDQRSTIIALAGLMGLRKGEISGLRWSDINFKEKMLYVRKQLEKSKDGEYRFSPLKTKASKRDLPIFDHVFELLTNEKKRQEAAAIKYGKDKFSKNLVCVHITNVQHMGEPFSKSYFNDMLGALLKDMEMPQIRLHDLRHSFGSNLIYQGQTISTVSYLMGHSNAQITMNTYLHIISTLEVAKYKEINETINNNLKKLKVSTEDAVVG